MNSLPPPDMTPPAWVSQIERLKADVAIEHRALRSRLETNHLAVLHQLGQLAEYARNQDKAIRAIADELRVKL